MLAKVCATKYCSNLVNMFVLHEQASIGVEFHVVKYEASKSMFECMCVCVRVRVHVEDGKSSNLLPNSIIMNFPLEKWYKSRPCSL